MYKTSLKCNRCAGVCCTSTAQHRTVCTTKHPYLHCTARSLSHPLTRYSCTVYMTVVHLVVQGSQTAVGFSSCYAAKSWNWTDEYMTLYLPSQGRIFFTHIKQSFITDAKHAWFLCINNSVLLKVLNYPIYPCEGRVLSDCLFYRAVRTIHTGVQYIYINRQNTTWT